MGSLNLRGSSSWLLLSWLALGILTLGGCGGVGYRSLSRGEPIGSNPRDYYDLGDEARVTLDDGRQIAGTVTQLRTDSIRLDGRVIAWSQVAVAERSNEDQVDPLRMTAILVVVVSVGILAYYVHVLRSGFAGLD